MKKKIFVVSLLIIVIISCLALPAAAAGYAGLSPQIFFSRIPFESVVISNATYSWAIGADFNTWIFEQTTDRYFQESSVSDASGPVLDYRFSQVHHSNNTNLYGCDLRLEFNDNVTGIEFRARDFAISLSDWQLLQNNCNVYAGSTGSVTWFISYAALDQDEKWVQYYNAESLTLESGGGWVPTYANAFPQIAEENLHFPKTGYNTTSSAPDDVTAWKSEAA